MFRPLELQGPYIKPLTMIKNNNLNLSLPLLRGLLSHL